jgi:DNA polymerase III subunit epsilon
MRAMRQIFLDTETTGLDARGGDRIVEIGCIEMVNRRLSGRTLHHYLNPERASHPDAERVHGLSQAFLADKPLFVQVVDELIEFIRGAELIIHNASFDVGFLNAELARAARPPVAEVATIRDSLTMAREMFPGKSNSLDALCKRLEVDNTNRTLHGALLDAGLLAEVYIRMTRGQDSLVIDSTHGGDEHQGLGRHEALDLASLRLVLLPAADDESAAHEALIGDIRQANGGRALWGQEAASPVA